MAHSYLHLNFHEYDGISGDIAVGEDVTVRIKDAANFINDGLRLRIRHHGKEIAMFPLDDMDQWVIDGEDATCELSLRTVQAFYAFARRPDISHIKCTVIVDCTEPGVRTLNMAETIQVKNWPTEPSGSPQPIDIPQWAMLMTALRNEFDSHTHTGGSDGQVLDHASLSNIGTKTHTQLEQEISDLSGDVDALGISVGGVEDDVESLEDDVESLENFSTSHSHTGGQQGQKINHGDLNGIGTRTHAELEGDMQAVDQKADAAALALLNHDHSGGASGSVLDITGMNGYSSLDGRVTTAESKIALLETFRDVTAPATYLAKPSSANYTVTAPVGGEYRNIREDMTGDQLARCLPTLVQDLINAGVL